MFGQWRTRKNALVSKLAVSLRKPLTDGLGRARDAEVVREGAGLAGGAGVGYRERKGETVRRDVRVACRGFNASRWEAGRESEEAHLCRTCTERD